MADLTTDIKKEFWGDLQADLYVKNTAVYLANQSLENLISTNGRKAHRPILSHPQVGTYTPHSDISFEQKSATKQTLEVDTFEYAAEDIDIVEEKQTPYDLVSHSLTSIRNGLSNRVEQNFLSEITNAGHTINSGTALEVSSLNILDILEEAEGKLGAFDAPYETSMRAAVFGPRTVAKLRRAKSDRESKLGDMVLENGIVGPWQGWNVVQNNNLPFTAVLTMATQPTAGDTVTIAGVTFDFRADPADAAAGNVGVDLGGDVDATRVNLAAAINDSGTAGTTYIQLSARDNFMLRRKRNVTAVDSAGNDTLTITGYGDISVSETFTAAGNVWTSAVQDSIFMIRGAIDMVLQFMELEIGDKEKGFAKLPKGMIGIGTQVFSDGADLMVRLRQDVSGF